MTSTDQPAKSSRFDILDKVRKLNAAAESLAKMGNAKAAENANNKAAALLAEYGIDAAMAYANLSADQKKAQAPVNKTMTIPAPFTTAKRRLLREIAEVYGVRCINLGGGEGQQYGQPVDVDNLVGMVGFDADTIRLELLYTSLLVQSGFELAKQFVPVYEQAEIYRESFYIGYAEAVVKRLRAAEERARDTAGTGTALVLRGRGDEVDKAYRNFYPTATAMRARAMGSGTGRNAGLAAGARADLGGARMGSRAQTSIGG